MRILCFLLLLMVYNYSYCDSQEYGYLYEEIEELRDAIKAEKDTMHSLNEELAELKGKCCYRPHPSYPGKASSIFTRWGRKDCPSGVSDLVYSGITGGSMYHHRGGAVEYVCLPPDPIYNENKHFKGSYWGYMYGAEYQQIPHNLLDNDVPCAVCRTRNYSTALMIPARNQCYKGWTEAYHGELVSGYYNHGANSQYACLDAKPQITGSKLNKDGKLMYPVKTQCGSLPCPPYENNVLLTCVVCLR